MEKDRFLDSSLINEAFQRKGWVMHHKFMAGNWFEKGKDTDTHFHGHFKINGEWVSDEFICDMLNIDKRLIQVTEAIKPHPIFSKYGQTFLAGVRWANQHPKSYDEATNDR